MTCGSLCPIIFLKDKTIPARDAMLPCYCRHQRLITFGWVGKSVDWRFSITDLISSQKPDLIDAGVILFSLRLRGKSRQPLVSECLLEQIRPCILKLLRRIHGRKGLLSGTPGTAYDYACARCILRVKQGTLSPPSGVITPGGERPYYG